MQSCCVNKNSHTFCNLFPEFNKIMRVGLVGTGLVFSNIHFNNSNTRIKGGVCLFVCLGWAIRVQLPIFRKAGLEVTAIYSRDAARADKLAKQHNIKHGFSSVESLCACPDVDIVSIVSPTHLHAEHAMIVLQAGKHLLCDKPMDADLQAAIRLLELSKTKRNQIAIIDHELRFLDCAQHARNSVCEAKTIGDIVSVSANFELSMSFGAKHSWWYTKEMGGGILGAVGVHVIDLCYFITGKKIQKLVALRDSQVKALPSRDNPKEMISCTAEDWVSVIGVLEGGQHFSISLNSSGSAPNRTISVMGTKGAALLNLDKVGCFLLLF
jgi:predicted dehydrogenase